MLCFKLALVIEARSNASLRVRLKFNFDLPFWCYSHVYKYVYKQSLVGLGVVFFVTDQKTLISIYFVNNSLLCPPFAEVQK